MENSVKLYDLTYINLKNLIRILLQNFTSL